MGKKMLHSAIAIVLLLTASCTKSTTKSKGDLLTQKVWLMTNMERRMDNGTWSNTPYTSMSFCERDNVTRFSKNGTYEINEAETKCNPSDPQIFRTGTWSLQEVDTKLRLDAITTTLEQLDEENFQITYNQVVNGVSSTMRVSYKH